MDVPYAQRGKSTRSLTTYDVAKILEDKYGIFATFYRVREKLFAAEIENSLQGAFEALVQGRTVDPWGVGMSRLQANFSDFILSGEAERVGIPGTPTKAALRGVNHNHRLKHPYRKSNPRRPSFKDTGLYVASTRFWID
jgi:hypothetical protein